MKQIHNSNRRKKSEVKGRDSYLSSSSFLSFCLLIRVVFTKNLISAGIKTSLKNVEKSYVCYIIIIITSGHDFYTLPTIPGDNQQQFENGKSQIILVTKKLQIIA